MDGKTQIAKVGLALIKILRTNKKIPFSDASFNRFIPFMMDYADFYGYKKSRTVYDSYSTFELIDLPPVSKLKMFASNKKSVSDRTSKRYLKLAEDVTEIRKMIRNELKN